MFGSEVQRMLVSEVKKMSDCENMAIVDCYDELEQSVGVIFVVS